MKYLYIVLLLTLSIMSCKEKEGNRDTELLEQYLQKQFNTDIAKDNSTYILLADQACSDVQNIFLERPDLHMISIYSFFPGRMMTISIIILMF